MRLRSTWTFRQTNRAFTLRSLAATDVDHAYVSWLNDSENRRSLWIPEGKEVTFSGQQDYVAMVSDSEDRLLLGVFDVFGDLVGTVGLQSIGLRHKHATLGLLIGNPAYRGTGLGSVFVWMGTSILCNDYGALKVEAGMLCDNVPSLRSFARAGYVAEGVLRRHVRRSDGWRDLTRVGCLRDELVDPVKLQLSCICDSETSLVTVE